MWSHLEPHSAKLETVFEPLQERAVEFDRPWSIAELRLPDREVTWLRDWFRSLTPGNTQNWIQSVMLAKFPGRAYATYRQMFGALLLCVAAEVCREESREDSVWPAVRSILPQLHALQQELFVSNGQPSSLTKDLICDAVRALNLRHAMDIEGTQQWFITIKLQFGFTYRGAKSRLAEWLVSLGRPHAVQYLDGDAQCPELQSESFQSLWRGLMQFRRDQIHENEIRQLLLSSPWVHAHWIDDLLQEAKARIATLGVGDWPATRQEPLQDAAVDDQLCPISGASLEWASGAVPQIVLTLDKPAVQEAAQQTDAPELDFYIDNIKVTRWRRQKDEGWAGRDRLSVDPDTRTRQPNLSPRTLSVRTRTGEMLSEWDLSDSGLSDEVLVFDMDTGRMLRAAEDPLDPTRRYVILCDRGCEIHGCTPTETYEAAGVLRKAMRLPSPLDGNICLSCRDFVLWQPVRVTEARPQVEPPVLCSPPQTILGMGDRTRLLLTGLPDDTDSVQLLIHATTYELQWEDEGTWITTEDVTITPELAARERRLRVRWLCQGAWSTREPRLSLRLLSAAILRQKPGDDGAPALHALKAGDEINRSEGTAYLRIWTPECSPRLGVYEGNAQAGRARHGKIRLREMLGHGGELRLLSEGQTYSLDVRCVDRGCIAGFAPSMLRTPASLSLSEQKGPDEVGDDGYSVWVWRSNGHGTATLEPLPPSAVLPRSTNRTWKLDIQGLPLAVALTWKGYWLGCWWGVDQIASYVEQSKRLSDAEFSVLKWLRTPVLIPVVASVLEPKVHSNPCGFLRAWLGTQTLPPRLVAHARIEGADFVVRRFLWTRFPPSHARDAIAIVANWDGGTSNPERYIGHLDQLANVSPILVWRWLELFLRRNTHTTIELLRAYLCARLGLPSDASCRLLRQRLGSRAEGAAESASITAERLEEIAQDWMHSMQKKEWHPRQCAEADLARVGETHSGRQYVAASVCRHWLNLSGEKDLYS